MDFTTGKTREVAKDVYPAAPCCTATGPTGVYNGMTGNEVYFQQMKGDRLQVLAVTSSGVPRVVADVPATLAGTTHFAVHGNKLAYSVAGSDSNRLQVVTGVGQRPVTLLTSVKTTGGGEFAWSRDGSMLATYTSDSPQKILVYRFDSRGVVQGVPQSITPAAEYFYEMFWLADGSGLTMIAQPKGASVTEVMLVKLADPTHPVFLSKSDPGNKWGHSLSPDGKWMAYPSEHGGGSAIHRLDVDALIKRGAK